MKAPTIFITFGPLNPQPGTVMSCATPPAESDYTAASEAGIGPSCAVHGALIRTALEGPRNWR